MNCPDCKFCDVVSEGGSFKGFFGREHFYLGVLKCNLKPPPDQPFVNGWDWCGEYKEKMKKEDAT